MIRNLKDGERIIELADGRKILRSPSPTGRIHEYVLSDECVCGKLTNFNQFWDDSREHQLCKECVMFTLAGTLEDQGFNITYRSDREDK